MDKYDSLSFCTEGRSDIMAVKIRLSRAGAKRRPYYHIVAADSRCRRDGKFIEAVGYYSPTAQPHRVEVDPARLQYWIKAGAQPTETVGRLLKQLSNNPSAAKA